MSWFEELFPDPWQRRRIIIRLALIAIFALLALWIACLPGHYRRAKLQAARDAEKEVAKQLAVYQARAHHFPPIKLMRMVAKFKLSVADEKGAELPTFDPGQLNPAQRDPFSPGSGNEPFVYYPSPDPNQHWLIDSVGPDHLYQLTNAYIAAFSNQGPAALTAIQYDPTNGTDSAGDIILTGP